MTTTMMLLTCGPALATLLALLTLVPWLASRHARKAESPYTPDLDSAEAWSASLDVALGLAWFQDSTLPAPVEACPVLRLVAAGVLPCPWAMPEGLRMALEAKQARSSGVYRIEAAPMTLRSAA